MAERVAGRVAAEAWWSRRFLDVIEGLGLAEALRGGRRLVRTEAVLDLRRSGNLVVAMVRGRDDETVKARLAGLDPRLEQAAMDLYANEWQTFWRVTFPLVFPGILAAALLSFSLSFDDFIITNLNAGQEVTFPMYVWGAAQRGVPPQINVIGTVMFLVALSLVVIGEVVSRRRAARV